MGKSRNPLFVTVSSLCNNEEMFCCRFKEFLRRGPGSRPPPLTSMPRVPPPVSDDPEYYNDLPGKAPPHATKEGTKYANVANQSSVKLLLTCIL